MAPTATSGAHDVSDAHAQAHDHEPAEAQAEDSNHDDLDDDDGQEPHGATGDESEDESEHEEDSEEEEGGDSAGEDEDEIDVLALGQADREVCDSVRSQILSASSPRTACSLLHTQAHHRLAHAKSDRTADIRTIYQPEKHRLNPDTKKTESGHWCTICRYDRPPQMTN